MSIEKVFCPIPWTEVHINADGTYHTCGAQPNVVSGTESAKKYNVHNMTIPEWINSQQQTSARLNKLTGIAEPLCALCYYEESVGSVSKRIKENLKSKITPVNFYDDYKTSPDVALFDYSQKNQGLTDFLHPTSYHISLGNECNLACKMCTPTSSSKIASQMFRAGTYSGPVRQNWTKDERAWQHVIDYICATKDLRFVHLIGGEPLMNPKFNQLIDQLVSANRLDIYLGFTTNGTIIDLNLLDKLNAFRHVDIGISVECTGELNDAIRGNTSEVLKNIDLYLTYKKENHVYITIRTVPSALSVHRLDDLYRWCISRKVDIMSNILTKPEYLQIKNLPDRIKQRLLKQYSTWQYAEPLPGASDPRDPNRYREHIDEEIRAIILALTQEADPGLTEQLYKKLNEWGWLNQPNLEKYFKIADV